MNRVVLGTMPGAEQPSTSATALPKKRDSVTQRALAILGCFSPARPSMSLLEISRCAGLPPATTHRLVTELREWGALERDEHGVYRIGLRLWEVAALAPRGLGLREAALPYLEDLYEATHQNVQLAVLDDLEVVFVERFAARDSVHVFTKIGGRFPAHATGVGLALLAHAPPDLQERAIVAPKRPFTTNTIVSATELRRVLAEVRKAGVAISDGQVELCAVSVAAPIFDATDTAVAAVSVVVPAGDCHPHTLVPAVRAAARGISRTLATPQSRISPKTDRSEGRSAS